MFGALQSRRGEGVHFFDALPWLMGSKGGRPSGSGGGG